MEESIHIIGTQLHNGQQNPETKKCQTPYPEKGTFSLIPIISHIIVAY